MAEQARQALDDRKAETEAARDPHPLIEPLEFLERPADLVGRDAEALCPRLRAG